MNHGEVGGRRDFFFTLGIPRGDSTYKKPSPFFLPICVLCHALTWAVNAQPMLSQSAQTKLSSLNLARFLCATLYKLVPWMNVKALFSWNERHLDLETDDLSMSSVPRSDIVLSGGHFNPGRQHTW